MPQHFIDVRSESEEAVIITSCLPRRIHLDIKKLGRIGSVGHRITGRYPGAVNRHLGIGWEFVHVCIDDTSRVAFVQVRANQRKESAVAFLEAAVAYFAKLGIRVERVMTDNGSC
jgi:hypothetical protein